MPRAGQKKVYANFSGGLVTEGNQLSYPENAMIDMDNLDLIEDGSVRRRPGLAYDGTVSVEGDSLGTSIAELATESYRWEDVNGNPDLNISVTQIGDKLFFYYLDGGEVLEQEALPAYTLVDTARPSASTTTLRKSETLSFTSGLGRLFVAGKYIDPIVIEYTPPAADPITSAPGTRTITTIEPKIRDFEIWKEGETTLATSGDTIYLSGEEKQQYQSGYHSYNLLNQGWPRERIDNPSNLLRFEEKEDTLCSDDPDGGGAIIRRASVYSYERAPGGTPPANMPTTADLFHTYQSGLGNSVTKQIAYNPWYLDVDYNNTTPSPRGSIIQEVFFINRYGVGDAGAYAADPLLVAPISVEENITAQFRPEAIAFYAGRLWFAGTEGSRYANNLYYTQVLRDDLSNIDRCYQEADPTAEAINSLVATDGGVLGIKEMGKVFKIVPIGIGLVVIASNGVWNVAGDGEVSTFTADNLSVRKVTDEGALGKRSVVSAKDSTFYFGDTAIYGVASGETGLVSAQDISTPSIKSFYDEVTVSSKKAAFAVFNEGSNRIEWYFRKGDIESDAQFAPVLDRTHNRTLYFDINLGAFGLYSLQITPELLVVGGITDIPSNTFDVDLNIVLGADNVVQGVDNVILTESVTIQDKSSVKLLTVVFNDQTARWEFRYSDFQDISTFADWGTSFSSYLETGFDSLADILSKAKKAPMLQTYFTRTESGFTVDPQDPAELIFTDPSSCFVRYEWDWGETPYSNPFQAYKLLRHYIPENVSDPLNYDQTIITTRNRLRGRGTSLGLRFESEDGFDFRLVGYAILYTDRMRP